MRYPGHRERMAMLRESGFFGSEEIEINGARVRPLDVTSRLLFPLWHLRPGEEDITVMRVSVTGRRDGKNVRRQWDLLDRYDCASGVHSMARTTGYTASTVVRLLAAGLFKPQVGICPPEFIGRDPRAVAFVLQELAARGVHYRESEVFEASAD